MTVNQLIRRLNKNAQAFAKQGDLARSFACAEVAAVMCREGFPNLRGSVFEMESSTEV